MKESEFLELLNLYLDHEISAADAARLEAAVSADPARRKVYDEYCRLHKACSLVAMDFRAADGAVVAASDKVVPFDFGAAQAAARRRRVVAWTNGGLAAAACMALAFVGFRSFTANPQSAVQPVAAQTNSAGAERIAATVATAGTSPSAGAMSPSTARELGGAVHARMANTEVRPAPKWVAPPLVISAQSRDAAPAALRQAEDQLAWIQSVQFAPIPSRLQVEQIRFDAAPASLQPEGRALGGRVTPATEPAVEMAAFRFVK